MTDNPWDELDKSSKEKSAVDGKSVVDFFSFSKKTKKHKSEKSKKDGKKDDAKEEKGNVFFFSDNSESKNYFNIDGLFGSIDFKFKNNLNLFFCSIFVLLFFWLLSGTYIVKQEETAVITRFGRYVYNVGAGLHYHLPYPIESVTKEVTTRVRMLKIGGDSYAGGRSDKVLGEGWALTGDENIVNLELIVQWKIDDLKKFIFKVRDKEQTIYDAAQSAIREVVSKRKLVTILTSGRSEIEEETKKLLQEMLNSYDIGVNILVVQMLKIDPPVQVLDSFRDVQTARVDKESEINKAYKYKNDILPKARGEAGKVIEDANGYAVSVINRAKGDSDRFNQVYEQYKNAPFVTRKRMYLEAMEELFLNNNVTILDENVKNVFLDANSDMSKNTERKMVLIDNQKNKEDDDR